jgi:hypothetical protein
MTCDVGDDSMTAVPQVFNYKFWQFRRFWQFSCGPLPASLSQSPTRGSTFVESKTQSAFRPDGLVCLLLIVTYRLYQHRQPTPKEAKTTDEIIQSLSSEAVKDADANNQMKLDYSVDSIKKVEQILGKLHEKYKKSQFSISVTGLSAAYGAYIGEVIRKLSLECIGNEIAC